MENNWERAAKYFDVVLHKDRDQIEKAYRNANETIMMMHVFDSPSIHRWMNK
jgi:hypothetical protein